MCERTRVNARADEQAKDFTSELLTKNHFHEYSSLRSSSSSSSSLFASSSNMEQTQGATHHSSSSSSSSPPSPPSCWRRVRAALSIVPRDATPLPVWPIAMATLAIFNCVLHMTLLFPFVPQMLRTFDVPESDIGELFFPLSCLESKVMYFLALYCQ